MYLLDTNHCSRIVNGDPALVRRVAEAANPVVTCVIVYGELTDMAYRSDRYAENIISIRQFLKDIGVYSVDEETADIYGRLRADLFLTFGPREKAKRRHFILGQMGVGENGLWIAAVALQHDLTIVSADGDFARLQQVQPFRVENWLTPPWSSVNWATDLAAEC